MNLMTALVILVLGTVVIGLPLLALVGWVAYGDVFDSLSQAIKRIRKRSWE